MDILNLMAGGAAFGVVAGCWERIKGCIWRFFNLFVQDIGVDDRTTKIALVNHLVGHFHRVGLYDKDYDCVHDYINTERRYGFIAYEKFGDRSVLFRRGWRPILFLASARQQGDKEAQSAPARRSLLFFRGTFDADRLVADALRAYNGLKWMNEEGPCKPRRFFVRHVPDFRDEAGDEDRPDTSTWQYHQSYRVIGRGLDEIGQRPDPDARKLDGLFFPDDVLDLIEEVRIWGRSREVYAEVGIPWKRGWLLHGPGGTGKSALAAAFAHDMDMPIFVFNLGELTNLEFMEEWRKMLTHSPCIALIEDVDNVFHGRVNVAQQAMSFGRLFGRAGRTQDDEEGKKSREGEEVARRFGNPLSFDVLLNCLDGVERAEGLFTIITTNHIEHIDPALGRPVAQPDGRVDFISTRPGRIDKAIELTYMLPEVKERMARQVLRRFPDLLDDFLIDLRRDPRPETPAQFQERCGQLALRAYWEQAGVGADRPAIAPPAGPGSVPPLKLCVGG